MKYTQKIFYLYLMLCIFHSSILHSALVPAASSSAISEAIASASHEVTHIAESMVPSWGTTDPTPPSTIDERASDIIKAYEEEKAAREFGDIEREVHEQANKELPEEDEYDRDSDTGTADELTESGEGIPISEIPGRVKGAVSAFGNRLFDFAVPGLSQFAKASELQRTTLKEAACQKLLIIDPSLSECQSSTNWNTFAQKHPTLIHDLEQQLNHLKSTSTNKADLLTHFSIDELKNVLELNGLPAPDFTSIDSLKPKQAEEPRSDERKTVFTTPPPSSQAVPTTGGMLARSTKKVDPRIQYMLYHQQKVEAELARQQQADNEIMKREQDTKAPEASSKSELSEADAARKIQTQFRARKARKKAQQDQLEHDQQQQTNDLEKRLHHEIESYLSSKNKHALKVYQEHTAVIHQKYHETIESIQEALKNGNIKELQKWNNVLQLQIENELIPTESFYDTQATLIKKLPHILEQLRSLPKLKEDSLQSIYERITHLEEAIPPLLEELKSLQAPMKEVEELEETYRNLQESTLNPEKISQLVEKIKQLANTIQTQTTPLAKVTAFEESLKALQQSYAKLQTKLHELESYKTSFHEIIQKLPYNSSFEHYEKEYEQYKPYADLNPQVVEQYKTVDHIIDDVVKQIPTIDTLIKKSKSLRDFFSHLQRLETIKLNITHSQNSVDRILSHLEQTSLEALIRFEENKPENLLVKNMHHKQDLLQQLRQKYVEKMSYLQSDEDHNPIYTFGSLTELLYKKLEIYHQLFSPKHHQDFQQIATSITEAIKNISEEKDLIQNTADIFLQKIETQLKKTSESITSNLASIPTGATEIPLENKQALKISTFELQHINSQISQAQNYNAQLQSLLERIKKEIKILEQVTHEEGDLQSLHAEINALISKLSSQKLSVDEAEHLRLYQTLHQPNQKNHREMIQKIQKILEPARKSSQELKIAIKNNIEKINKKVENFQQAIQQLNKNINQASEKIQAQQQSSFIEEAVSQHQELSERLEQQVADSLKKEKEIHEKKVQEINQSEERQFTSNQEQTERENITTKEAAELQGPLHMHQQALAQDLHRKATIFTEELPSFYPLLEHTLQIIEKLETIVKKYNTNNALQTSFQSANETAEESNSYVKQYQEAYQLGTNSPSYLLDLLEEGLEQINYLEQSMQSLSIDPTDLATFMTLYSELEQNIATIRKVADKYHDLLQAKKRYQSIAHEITDRSFTQEFNKSFQQTLLPAIKKYTSQLDKVHTVINFNFHTDITYEKTRTSMLLDTIKTIENSIDKINEIYDAIEKQYTKITKQQEELDKRKTTALPQPQQSIKNPQIIKDAKIKAAKEAERTALMQTAKDKKQKLATSEQHEFQLLRQQFETQKQDIIQQQETTEKATTKHIALGESLLQKMQQLHKSLAEQVQILQLNEEEKKALLTILMHQEQELRDIVEAKEASERDIIKQQFEAQKQILEQQNILQKSFDEHKAIAEEYENLMRNMHDMKAEDYQEVLNKLETRLATEKAIRDQALRQLQEQEKHIALEAQQRTDLLSTETKQFEQKLKVFENQITRLSIEEAAKQEISRTLAQEQEAAVAMLNNAESLERQHLESIALQHNAMKQLEQAALQTITNQAKARSTFIQRAEETKKELATSEQDEFQLLRQQFNKEQQYLAQQQEAVKTAANEYTAIGEGLIQEMQQLHKSLTEQVQRLQLNEEEKKALLTILMHQEQELRNITEAKEASERDIIKQQFETQKQILEQQSILQKNFDERKAIAEEYEKLMKNMHDMKAEDYQKALNKLENRLATEKAIRDQAIQQLEEREKHIALEAQQRTDLLSTETKQFEQKLKVFENQIARLSIEEAAKQKMRRIFAQQQKTAVAMLNNAESLERQHLESITLQLNAIKQLKQAELEQLLQNQRLQIDTEYNDDRNNIVKERRDAMNEMYKAFKKTERKIKSEHSEREQAEQLKKEKQQRKEAEQKQRERFHRKKEKQEKEKTHKAKSKNKAPKPPMTRPAELTATQLADPATQRAEQEAKLRKNLLEGKQAAQRIRIVKNAQDLHDDLISEEQALREQLAQLKATELAELNKAAKAQQQAEVGTNSPESTYSPPTAPVYKPKNINKGKGKKAVKGIPGTAIGKGKVAQATSQPQITSTAKVSTTGPTVPTAQPYVPPVLPSVAGSTPATSTSVTGTTASPTAAVKQIGTSKTTQQKAKQKLRTPEQKKENMQSQQKTKSKSFVMPAAKYKTSTRTEQSHNKPITQSHRVPQNSQQNYYPQVQPEPYLPNEVSYNQFDYNQQPYNMYDESFYPYEDYENYYEQAPQQPVISSEKQMPKTTAQSVPTTRSKAVSPNLEESKKASKKVGSSTRLKSENVDISDNVVSSHLEKKDILPRKGRKKVTTSNNHPEPLAPEQTEPIQEAASKEKGFFEKVIESITHFYDQITAWIWPTDLISIDHQATTM